MSDFKITGTAATPSFDPCDLGDKNHNGVITANNLLNPAASITLYIYAKNTAGQWVTSTTLFTPAVSSVAIPSGNNQTVGTIGSTAGSYLLSPSSTPPNVLEGATGGNVKINVS